jgi:hypothetical protein
MAQMFLAVCASSAPCKQAISVGWHIQTRIYLQLDVSKNLISEKTCWGWRQVM